MRVEHEAANVRLAARLARVEAQQAHDSKDSESLQRLAFDIRQTHEEQRTFAKISEERIIALETGLERAKRDEASVREHMGVLQKDFREFSVSAVSRQRSEIEHEVTKAFARQNAATEEWRGALKQRDAQMQAEIQRVSNAVEDNSGELVRAHAELRTRISALEAARMSGRNPPIMSPGADGFSAGDAGGSHMVGYLKQHVDALRQSSEQVGARLAELWARCEGEAVSHHATKQDAETRFAALSRAIATERDNLALRLSQRLEVLESRLGVERSEQAAKQAEIVDQVASGDHQGYLHLQDLASKFRTELESAERRLQGEVSALRNQVEADMSQFSFAQKAEEEGRRSSLGALLQRLEGSVERQTEVSNSLRQEVDASVRDIRETLRTETAARTESERKLATDAGKAAQTLAAEVGSLQKFVKKHAESVAADLDRLRVNATERADRLSRYVDEKVGLIIADPSSSRLSAETAALEERLTAVKNEAEEQARVAEQRFEACNEDIRFRIRQVEEAWQLRESGIRRESDRSDAAAEKRVNASQDELKARFEAYVKHFDASIASLQAAILRPVSNAAPDSTPQQSLSIRSPEGAAPNARNGPVIGWRSVGNSTPAKAASGNEHWRPSAEWQSQELKSVVDLRVHEEPDLASLVRATISRGDMVTVKDIIERDGRRWASLGGLGGFVLAFSEGGTPLLEALPILSPAQPPQHFFASATHLRETPASLPAASPVNEITVQLPEIAVEIPKMQEEGREEGREEGELIMPEPLSITGEDVQQQVAQEIAFSVCRLDTTSDETEDLRDRALDFDRAVEEEEHVAETLAVQVFTPDLDPMQRREDTTGIP
jgi:hypothetical protein